MNELICSQLNNAGSVFTSEPSTMDTLNSEHTLNTHNSICDSNASLKAEAGELADKPTVGQQPVIMSSILKSALIGKRTYAQPVRLDESVVLADTTVTEDEEKPADLGQESRMRKKEIDELIRQLIQVDDYYTNCGRFINAKAAGESGPNENRKLIQYVRKPADDPELPDNGQPTDKAVEDLNELIQEQEDEPSTASNELSAAEEDKEDEMLSIIVDKQRSLNGEWHSPNSLLLLTDLLLTDLSLSPLFSDAPRQTLLDRRLDCVQARPVDQEAAILLATARLLDHNGRCTPLAYNLIRF